MAAVWASVLCMTLLAAAAVLAGFRMSRETARADPPAPSIVGTPVLTPPPSRGLRPSRPVRLVIPRLKVRTALLSLGKNPDGTLEVPPAARAQLAGWYRLGVAPGARGPAVIAGHVDSRTGPAVFYRLGELRPGDLVQVLRRDRLTAVFRIDSVERVAKDRFPTKQVYAHITYPGLRLITCGGAFDQTTRQYTDNVIAFGHLVAPGPSR